MINKETDKNKNGLVPPKLGDAVKSFRRFQPAKFLYINEELLLSALPLDAMKKDPVLNGGFDIPKDYKFQFKRVIALFGGLIPLFGKAIEYGNEKIKDLKRIKVTPKGIHVPLNSTAPLDFTPKILNGELLLDELTDDIRETLIVQTLTKDDYLCSPVEGVLDWLNCIMPARKRLPYTIFPDNTLSPFGYPIGLYTKGDEDVDPESIKHIFYREPRSGKVTKGIYFEVYESSGVEGPGGVNGIIVEEGKPVVIINTNKKEAYFVNVEDSRRNLAGMDLSLSKLQVVG